MAYPELRPTSRNFDPGNWPVKTYNSQNGTEVRLLYGSQRYNLRLQLTYQHVSDTNAELFITHYNDQKGTYNTFSITGNSRTALMAGWDGTTTALSPPAGVDWRYEQPPQIVSVRPGVSTVTVSLVGVI